LASRIGIIFPIRMDILILPKGFVLRHKPIVR